MNKRWLIEPLDYASVARSRHEFSAWLSEHVSAANPLLEYELVFGELLTNAVRYGARPVHAEIAVRTDELSITVEDSGNCFDLNKISDAKPLAEGGRGLEIVKTLASRLSVADGPDKVCTIVATMPILAPALP
jgi:anti-sigma regulatory factor (Ser/Thr protein kinase)